MFPKIAFVSLLPSFLDFCFLVLLKYIAPVPHTPGGSGGGGGGGEAKLFLNLYHSLG